MQFLRVERRQELFDHLFYLLSCFLFGYGVRTPRRAQKQDHKQSKPDEEKHEKLFLGARLHEINPKSWPMRVSTLSIIGIARMSTTTFPQNTSLSATEFCPKSFKIPALNSTR